MLYLMKILHYNLYIFYCMNQLTVSSGPCNIFYGHESSKNLCCIKKLSSNTAKESSTSHIDEVEKKNWNETTNDADDNNVRHDMAYLLWYNG